MCVRVRACLESSGYSLGGLDSRATVGKDNLYAGDLATSINGWLEISM